MAIRSVPQPPFSAELLADLHAGNVDPELGAQLWVAARDDSEAAAYLKALDDVDDRLRALAVDDRILHPMPPDVAARMERFLEELDSIEEPTERVATLRPLPNGPRTTSVPTGAEDSPPHFATPLSPRRRHVVALRWLAAAAAVVAVIAGAGVATQFLRGDESPPTAGPATTDTGGELTSTLALAALGRNDVSGQLGSRSALADCVRAAGLDRAILGSTDMNYRGGAAVLILLSGPYPPKITALVVGPGCGVGDPQVKNITDIG
ncbi:hypothetical protein [Nocardia noduli]|uniref:hypothetical protein n=1 Tax=Nocardia noduli TaxID=2815722 RepID=UPI001C21EF54|nr:hypothetical protein [Nocardia noduli]